MNTAPERGRAATQPSLQPWEQKLVTLLMVLVTAFSILPAGLNLGPPDFDVATKGSLVFKLQWGLVFGLAMLLVVRHGGQTLWLLRRCNLFLLLFAAWSMATAAWALLPFETIKKSIEFWGLIAVALTAFLDPRPWTHAFKAIVLTMTAIMLASAVVALTVPSVGIDAYFGYAWRGLLEQKNGLGGAAALCLITWVGMWRLEGLSAASCWWGAGLSALCVLMSTSSTGITVAAVGGAVCLVLRRQYIGSPLAVLRVLVTLGLVVVLALHVFYVFEARLPERSELLGPFAGLFGKGADLTSRSDIWALLILEIEKHWLFGIGYGGFWLGIGSPAQGIIDALQWVPNEGHNGFLDMVNEMGLVGLVLFLCALLLGTRQLFLMSRFERRGAALLGALMVAMMVHNLSETTMPLAVSFELFMIVFCLFNADIAVARRALVKPSAAARPQT